MKKLFLPLIMAVVLTGCSTFQYSSRSVDVRNRNIGTKETAAEVVADYGRVVTATSDYQVSKSEAIREAEYRCIMENKIDVVVDPVFKVEFSPMSLSKKYRATITGYAGMYKQAPAGVDAVKSYSKEEIEKYKLLSDPSFPQYYYNNGTGDSYYINSSTGQAVKTVGNGLASLAIAPKAKTPKAPKQFDFFKAKKVRNFGIGLTIAGAVSMLAIGVPCLTSASGYTYSDYNDYYYGGYNYTFNESMYSAGIAFTVMGTIASVAGIPMWCVGSYRMKKSGSNAKVSVGGTSRGVGLRLNF